jgi:hypothetical protein
VVVSKASNTMLMSVSDVCVCVCVWGGGGGLEHSPATDTSETNERPALPPNGTQHCSHPWFQENAV